MFQQRAVWLPASLLLVLVVLFTLAGSYLYSEQQNLRRQKANSIASQSKAYLQTFSAERIQALNNLMQSWPSYHSNIEDWFNVQAQQLSRVQMGYHALSHADQYKNIAWVHNTHQANHAVINAQSVGLSLDETGLVISPQQADFQSTLVVFEEGQNNHYYLNIGRAISEQEIQHGYIFASFDLNKIFNVILGDLIGSTESPRRRFIAQLKDDNSVLFSAGGNVEFDKTAVSKRLSFIGRDLTLSVQTRKENPFLAITIILVGSFMSFVICWVLHKQLSNAENLALTQQRFQAASNASLDALLIFTRHQSGFRLIAHNEYAEKLLAKHMSLERNTTLTEQLETIKQTRLLSIVERVAKTGIPFEDHSRVDLNGVEWIRIQIVKAGGDIAITVRDVSQEVELQRRVKYQATHDQLTGLFNRYAFDQALHALLLDTKKSGEMAVMCFIDMDRFKLVNDTCGHSAGDRLLKEIAALFSQHVEEKDTLARIGGDEFCIIFKQSKLEDIKPRLDSLLFDIAAFRFRADEQTFFVGASIGVIAIEEHHTNANELIKAADNACYQAKYSGRNQYHIYRATETEQHDSAQEGQALRALQHALTEKGFALYCQRITPLHSPDDGFEYEILLRMLNKQGEMVNPAVFIPLAERHGLMNKVDWWVVDNTLCLLETHSEHLSKLNKVAINLAGTTLGDANTLEKIADRVHHSCVLADKLCFEITETEAVTNLTVAKHFISSLKALGCRFALDDFGVGMSSFSYLKHLDVDYVKIDGSFVRNMTTDNVDVATVQAINSLAHGMGKKTVAEFVGDEKTVTLLQKLGVDYGQGYALGKPVPLLHVFRDESVLKST
jgi:diguanylate cyclase (GGDEF)-like protein